MKYFKFNKTAVINFLVIFFFAGTNFASAQTATGGNFTLEQTVVASGGGQNSTGGAFSVDGTIGQSIAGTTSLTDSFSVAGGFWMNFIFFAPTADNQTVAAIEDTPVNITLSASAPNNAALTYSIVENPTRGTLSGTGANLTYTPDADYFGGDSFTFKVSNGANESNIAVVTINISEVNDTPRPVNDGKTTAQDATLTFAAADLTVNDNPGPANENSQTLTVTRVSATSQTNGQVSLNNRQINYQPNAGFSGAANFEYEVCDNGTIGGQADAKCATAVVNITVAAAPSVSYEGDVAPRPSGSGTGGVSPGDITQIRRFIAGLDTPDTPTATNEFQRADVAPHATRGDGRLTPGDITQTRRYAAGLDAAQIAAGPMTPQTEESDWTETPQNQLPRRAKKSPAEANAGENGRTVRPSLAVVNGSVITVAVSLNTPAGETEANAVGFTLTFDPAVLSNPTNIRLGADAPAAATITPNTNQAANGRVGIVLDLPVNPAQTFPTGNAEIILIDFTVASNPPPNTTLGFVGSPVERFVGDIFGNELQTAFVSATITLQQPTSATVSISGRVLTPDGRGLRNALISLTDARGETRLVNTGWLGHYRFDAVTAGEIVILSVRSKQYRFAPQAVFVTGEIENLDITALDKMRK